MKTLKTLAVTILLIGGISQLPALGEFDKMIVESVKIIFTGHKY